MVLYTEVKEYILKKIEEQEYKPGCKIPPEREFTEKLSASRMTIRRAVDELIQEGILIKKKGKGVSGTYVAVPKKERNIDRISIFTDQEFLQEYGQIRIEVLETKVVQNHSVSQKLLGTDINEKVLQVKRIQYGWDIPIVYENIFFPFQYFPHIQEANFKQSISLIVDEYLRKDIHQGKTIVEVESLLSTQKISTYLSLSKDSPILQLNIVVYDKDNHPIYCGKDSYDGNSFKYSSERNE